MYDNISKKIKILAEVLCIVNVVLLIISSIIMFIAGDILGGIVVLLLSPIISWVSTFTLYGLGELIEKVNDINKNLIDERRERAVEKEIKRKEEAKKNYDQMDSSDELPQI